MATTVRNLTDLTAAEAISVLNKLRLDIMKVKLGSFFHAFAATAIATANATDLPTSVALTNALKVSYNAHVISVCDATTGIGQHIATGVANVTAVANATDLTTAIALLNDIKAKFNLHAVQSGVHMVNDSTIATADATDQASANTLANAIKVKLNSHYAASMNSQATFLVSP